ncbi:MAG: DUF3343 domain-containing protein [Anaerolineae bacterium]|nr:DUF3343 domain-containing protein [Anaerolineae bacterium]
MPGPDGMAVVLFDSVQAAIQAEHAARAEGIAAKLIPVPRHLSTDCGMALRIPRSEELQVRALLERLGIAYRAVRAL